MKLTLEGVLEEDDSSPFLCLRLNEKELDRISTKKLRKLGILYKNSLVKSKMGFSDRIYRFLRRIWITGEEEEALLSTNHIDNQLIKFLNYKPHELKKYGVHFYESEVKANVYKPNYSNYTMKKIEEKIVGGFKALLRPVLLENLEFDEFVHYGIMHAKGRCGYLKVNINNIKNLNKLGIFGDPNERRPTGVVNKLFGSLELGRIYGALINNLAYKVQFVNNSSYGVQLVKLTIDVKELCKQRELYIDPESIYEKTYSHEFGNCFFVLGGIPKKAIKSIEITKE